MKNLIWIAAILAGLFITSCKSSKPATKIPVTSQAVASSLENTFWQLAEVDGKPTVTPEDGNEAHIKLSPGNNLQGYAGCNQLMGSYSSGPNNAISFKAASTKKMCDNMATERFMMNALTQANRYKIEGEYLQLYKGDKLLAYFKDMHF